MARARTTDIIFSRISVKSQTVIPRQVRDMLGLGTGDLLRYRITPQGVLIDKAPAADVDDPFATFSEWAGAADEEAYADL
ncbi:MAG TPA: AbrB family transcriptional regulator [Xanthobacteraceae bacterium]|nr:AbrB family transcriptional regulator [Xanthobacteraceae bacterium]